MQLYRLLGSGRVELSELLYGGVYVLRPGFSFLEQGMPHVTSFCCPNIEVPFTKVLLILFPSMSALIC